MKHCLTSFCQFLGWHFHPLSPELVRQGFFVFSMSWKTTDGDYFLPKHTVLYVSLHGRRPRGGKGKKNSVRRAWTWGKVTPARMLLFSSFSPLIKYAKPTQLWNVWLSKLSNQNHAAFFAVKSVDADGFSCFLYFSYFLFLFFAWEIYLMICRLHQAAVLIIEKA